MFMDSQYRILQIHRESFPNEYIEIVSFFSSLVTDRRIWPSGVYGLPTPTSGCPNNSGVIWETGSRLQDTENEYSSNAWSTGIQLLGPYERNDMTQNFCMKTHDEAEGDWPQGRYCVFKYGPSCPKSKA